MVRLVTILVLSFASTAIAAEGKIRPESAPISTSWEMAEDTLIIQIKHLYLEPITQIYITDHHNDFPEVVSLTIDNRPSRGDWIEIGPSPIYPGKIATNMTVGPVDSIVTIKLLAPGASKEKLNWFIADPNSAFGFFSGCCQNMGDVDHTGIPGNVDISDLTYLVGHLFLGGEAPVCPAESDLDGDGQVNIGDLTKIVDYFFRGSGELRPCPL